MSAIPPSKIPLLLVCLTGDKGGVDRVVEQWLMHAGLEEFAVTVIARAVPGILDEPSLASRVRLIRMPFPEGRPTLASELLAVRTVLRESRRTGPAVLNVHDHYGLLACLPAWRLWARRLPLVATVHMHTSWIPGNFRAKGVMSASERFMLRRARALIAVSQDYAGRLARLGYPPERIRTVHNGIDLSAFGGRARPRSEARQSLGLTEGQFVFGFAGRFALQKRPLELIRAVGLLSPEERAGAVFLLAGQGGLQAEMQAEIATRNLEKSVRLVGQITDIQRFYSALDVLLCPSSMEGLSMTLLEAMAAGVPVVATRVGGNEEIVEDPVHGWLLDDWEPATIAAGIRRVLAERAEVPARGSAARRQIEAKFSVQRMVTETSAVFRAVWREAFPGRAGTYSLDDYAT